MRQARIHKIVTGGQTGVDRAALDFALAAGIPCGGWCPKGRKAKDGIIAAHYPLQETPAEVYEQRTEWNVRDSDGTLVVVKDQPEGGTAFTVEMAVKYGKPYFVVCYQEQCDVRGFSDWISKHNIRILNVAGHRESHAPGEVYRKSMVVLQNLLQE